MIRKTISCSVLLFIFCGSLLSATYYSQGSVAPNLTGSWNTVRAGGGSTPGNFTAGDIFVIQNGHSMTTSATWSVSGTASRVWIESGGTLTATSAITLASVTTFQIDNGGSYVHSNTTAMASNIFQGTEVFGATSNFTYTLIPGSFVAPSSPGFGNLTFNMPTNAASIGCGGLLTQVQGNLTFTSTGTGGTIRLALVASAGNSTLNIGGNLVINGATALFYLSSGSSSATVNIAGNLTISDGILDLSNNASGGAGTLNIGGNFNQSGGTLRSNSSNISSINFTGGAASATFTQSGGTFTNTNINWQIATGKTVALESNITMVGSSRTMTVNGSFQINAGAYPGNSGTWSYGTAGTLIYNNSSNFGENGGNYWPTASGPVNVTLLGAGGLTLNVARTITGTLTLNSGLTNSSGTNKVTVNGGTVQMNGGGFVATNPLGYSGTPTLIYNTTSYTTSTNEFPASGINNVTITAPSGTNTVTLDGDKTITGLLSVGNHILTGGKSITAATINIGTGSMTMGNITTSGAFTCTDAAAISLNGNWAANSFVKSTSTVTFTGTGSLNNATSFYNLTNSAGTRSIIQNIDVENTLLVSGGQMGVTGGTGRSLTMSGSTATINIAGGSVFGTDAGAGNDLSLIVSGLTTLTGNATGSLDDEKKFFNVTVNNGSTLVLARGILCKYGTFTVNGTVQINANGYVQNDGSYGANAKIPAYNASTGALIYNNGGPYTNAGEWGASNSPFNVTIQNSSSVTLSGTRTIGGSLTFSTGSLNLANFDLNIASTLALSSSQITTGNGKVNLTTAESSVTRSSGYVVGNLQRTVANGTNIFNIGTATVYAPATINMTGLSGTVEILGKVTQGNHPNQGTAPIDPTKKADHYWTFTKSGAGTFTDYTGTFNVANTSNTGTVSNYKIAKFDPSTWSAVGGSASGNDITSASFTSFSEFIAGESSCTAPTSLFYTSNTVSYCTSVAISTNSTSFTGSAATSYAISPVLPDGLSFNTGNGEITGTPSVIASAMDYTVTVTNACGNTTRAVNITVNQAPSALSYTSNTVSYCVNTAIATNSPTFIGSAAISYAISPALPDGLNFNTTTGEITGTPTMTAAAVDYTVTITNPCGMTTRVLNITVNARPTAGTCKTDDLCQTNVGTVTVEASGGTAPYNVAWTPTHGSPSSPQSISMSGGTLLISGLSGGVTYTFIVTDANGCTVP